jgi:hypothetical protein
LSDCRKLIIKKVPFKSIIIILLALIWLTALLDKITIKDFLIISISMFIGGFEGCFILEKGREKSS